VLSDKSYFLWRKVHSLTGIVPLGMYVLVHLFLNSFVLLGEGSFVDGVHLLHRMPYLPVLEWVLIYIPLAIHAVLGLVMIFEARYNTIRYGYSRNWWFWFQRVSAVLILLFLAWHVATTRVALALGQVTIEGFYELLRGQFQDPLWLAVFVVGIAATTLHLGNGLWGFLVSWGVVKSRMSQRAFAGLCIAAGALMLVGFINVGYHYASGKAAGGILPLAEGEPVAAPAHEIPPDAEMLP
jgi:succinate dehydrogenase / fumarate reductase cytochrome b subunit